MTRDWAEDFAILEAAYSSDWRSWTPIVFLDRLARSQTTVLLLRGHVPESVKSAEQTARMNRDIQIKERFPTLFPPVVFDG